MVAHLPADAAVWRATGPDTGWTRDQIVLAALERRVTLLWATIATALGGRVSENDVTGPLDGVTTTASTAHARQEGDEPEVRSLREIALWMRQG
ncbi:hypothetical protein [Saccharothrix xinjiangensis]|uniref:Uncharacterized protein n=1 Tax=Saccharothrix xinjiangensis TaxID=204798 RepID=A0ABV9Y2E5_9PSEU